MSASAQHVTGTDEWNIASVDVGAYLERVGHSRVAPSAEVLRSLHETHVRAIPFENVDVQHRLSHGEGLWTLSKYGEHGWEALHAFDDVPQRPVDYEVAHHYTATHPHSPFTGRLVVMRLDHGVSRRLIDDELTVEYASGRVEHTRIPPERLDDTLRDLGIVLDSTELDALHPRLG